MHIRKITKVLNIGKFHKGGVSGGEYGKFTLFYAGNGRGKTTLCAILRSLKTNTPAIIQERRTLGSLDAPEASILCDSGVVAFTGGAWNSAKDAVHVFDGTFITDNVHAGELVSTDNRRNIYRVIVGALGVKLAEEVDALDATVTDLTSKIAAEKKALQQHVPGGMAVEKFLALAEDVDIDAKIAEQKNKIAAAAKSAEIAAKPLLKAQAVPSLSVDFPPALGKTVAAVSAVVATKVGEHLSKHKFAKDGQAWISTGLKHIEGDSCPFCANDLKGNSLIELYGQFFDQTYNNFKAELTALKGGLQSLSEASGLKAKAGFDGLAKDVDYWNAFGKVSFTPSPSLEAMAVTLAALHDAASASIDAKIAAPLETPDLSKLKQAMADWDKEAAALKASNESITHANAGIQAIKTSAASVNKAALDAALVELEATKKRHSAAVKALSDNYKAFLTEKEARVADKEKKKEELDTYDATVLAKYHDAINNYLTQFGAGFRLMKSEKNYVGKAPQWAYVIEINKHAVDVTKKPGLGEPSFQTAMSAGDRSTLALSFFLAQLDMDAALKDAVVVFDDPFTSLDEFRKAMTAKTMFRVGQAASQVIVFSHDKYFLEAVSDSVTGAKCATFQISSTKANSCIEAWDLAREVKDGYLRAHMDMQDFHDGKSGTASEMRLKMRPLLESYIRYRFPNKIPDGKWLGDMLAIVRDDPAHPLLPVYQEIEDINGFTAPHHHNANESFNEDEVRAYVYRTLAVVGGC